MGRIEGEGVGVPLAELRPGGAAIGGLVDPAPSIRVDRGRVRRIDENAVRLADELQKLRPGGSAVGRLEDPAPGGASPGRVGVAGIDGDAQDPGSVRVVRPFGFVPDALPGGSAVGGLVEAAVGGGPDRARGLRGNGEGEDLGRAKTRETRAAGRPVHAAVGALPDAAAVRAGPERARDIRIGGQGMDRAAVRPVRGPAVDGRRGGASSGGEGARGESQQEQEEQGTAERSEHKSSLDGSGDSTRPRIPALAHRGAKMA